VPVRDQLAIGPAADRSRSSRGQSLVEFALVLPLLMILLLGVADFGRIFSAGITIEAATRNAAEAGAIERLRNPPDFSDSTTWNAYYGALHEQIARVACSESRLLPNTTFVEGDRSCPDMPVIRACVHDGRDTLCGQPISGFADPIPASCTHMSDAWVNTSGGDNGSHFVEVRVCYRFTTLFNLHLALPFSAGINLGDVWLQKERTFVIDCPPGDVTTC
jgi:hypothetical protein